MDTRHSGVSRPLWQWVAGLGIAATLVAGLLLVACTEEAVVGGSTESTGTSSMPDRPPITQSGDAAIERWALADLLVPSSQIPEGWSFQRLPGEFGWLPCDVPERSDEPVVVDRLRNMYQPMGGGPPRVYLSVFRMESPDEARRAVAYAQDVLVTECEGSRFEVGRRDTARVYEVSYGPLTFGVPADGVGYVRSTSQIEGEVGVDEVSPISHGVVFARGDVVYRLIHSSERPIDAAITERFISLTTAPLGSVPTTEAFSSPITGAPATTIDPDASTTTRLSLELACEETVVTDLPPLVPASRDRADVPEIVEAFIANNDRFAGTRAEYRSRGPRYFEFALLAPDDTVVAILHVDKPLLEWYATHLEECA